MNILVGEISSYKAIVICKYIKKNYANINIISYDYKTQIKGLITKYTDKHFQIKKKDINSYIFELIKLIQEEKIDVYLPIHSDFIGIILQNKQAFGKTLSYLGDFESYQKLHNKNLIQEIVKDLDIVIPYKYETFKDAKLPFVAKPISGSSSKGVLYFFNENKRNKFFNYDFSNYIFQEYIQGTGCGYSVYAVNGEIKIGYGHLRLAEYPISGGSSVYRTSFYKEEMYIIAKKIFEKIPWTGFAMFEFKLTPKGELILIEVNPRIWGSINQGLQNGIDYFEPILKAKKKDIKENKQSKKINTYLSPQIYLSLLFYLIRGNIKPLILFLKNVRNNKADVSLFDDPTGWLSILLRKIL
ncbi:ATP-grasp domain-containing protein [Rosettibacter firmus]|uniref:ATP-grasp domain-containing protein n=1 Tax=Rosettibacter firmus TaxID=3111522 RepID=UPI00336BBEA2